MSAVEFWTKLAGNDRGLPQKIVAFNYFPVRVAHPSHFEHFLTPGTPWLSSLLAYPNSCRRLMERLPRKSGYKENIWDFSDPRLRLALLESNHLESILYHAGAALLHEEISKEIARPKLTDLIQRYGKDLYEFAVKKAPVLVGSPKVFPVFPLPESLVAGVEQAGRTLFEYCFQKQPDSFLHRLELRFPAGWKWDWSGQQPEIVSETAWKWLHRIAVREVAVEAAPCFE